MNNKNENLIYGIHTIYEILEKNPKFIKKIWSKNKLDEKYMKIIKSNKIDFKIKDNFFFDNYLNKNSNHQSIIAETKEYHYYCFNEMIKYLGAFKKSVVLILDKIQDPYNFGSIIRTASLLNVNAIIIPNKNQVFVNSTVMKVSSGTIFDIKISKVANLNNAVNQLKKIGYWVYATNLNNESMDIRNVDFTEKTVLIVGNEKKGISDLLTKNSDFNVHIPSSKNIDSFNVSNASAITLFQISSKLNNI